MTIAFTFYLAWYDTAFMSCNMIRTSYLAQQSKEKPPNFAYPGD
jgi:hypothetical protein